MKIHQTHVLKVDSILSKGSRNRSFFERTLYCMQFASCSLLLSLAMLLHTSAVAALPAFPGAEGFGAEAIGGRGGQVIKVTNLNDNGPGSFREATLSAGPRIVVFEVSGIINLESELYITEPYLTIAGQTSPGGVLVTGYQTTVRASHVIMQHMRFRVGSHRISDGADAEKLDSFDIWGSGATSEPVHDIIVDQCSFGWGVDETFSTAYNLKNITVSNSIIAEGLHRAGHPKGSHSKGMLVWAKYSPEITISLHQNYFAHNADRNPEINSMPGNTIIVDVSNNVAYNFYGGYAMGTVGDGVRVNWRHNYSRGGADSNSQYYEVYHESSVTPSPSIYVESNIGGSRATAAGSDWTVASSWRFELQSEAWRQLTAWPHAPVTTAPMTEEFSREIVLKSGATKPVRDSADTKVVNDYLNGTGRIRDNVVFPDDFPSYDNAQPPADSDDDGMSNAWEIEHNLDPEVNDAAQDADGDGYTNIEEYLHELAGLVDGSDSVEISPPMPPSSIQIVPQVSTP